MSEKPLILLHPPLPLFEPQLAAYEVVHWPTDRAVVAAVTVGSVGLTNAMIDKLPTLKTIVCFGVGVDGVDLAHCRARGVQVSHGRDINHEDVADVAMGLLIAAVRGFAQGERTLRAGEWKPPLAIGPRPRLRGRKLGIVGMGAIGQAIAARAAPFGLDIRWTAPRAKPDVPQPYEPDLTALARWSDILAVAARGDKSTEKIINAGVIEALGPDGFLINVARGSVIDEDAMIAALKAGKLAGAGLDVFTQEPTPAARWADVPNIIITPHLGGATRESLIMSGLNVLENLRRAVAGEPLLTAVPE